ncbi:MAG TPA: hypothetical protein EYP36_03650 [Calditrichaeota bacterium]|nr:hypothetical protein [Calditrichota bacterium]
MKINTKFRVLKIHKVDILYENDEVVALNKPPFLTSDEAAKEHNGAKLLHRKVLHYLVLSIGLTRSGILSLYHLASS